MCDSVLHALSANGDQLYFNDIVRITGLPKDTVHSYLNMLKCDNKVIYYSSKWHIKTFQGTNVSKRQHLNDKLLEYLSERRSFLDLQCMLPEVKKVHIEETLQALEKTGLIRSMMCYKAIKNTQNKKPTNTVQPLSGSDHKEQQLQKQNQHLQTEQLKHHQQQIDRPALLPTPPKPAVYDFPCQDIRYKDKPQDNNPNNYPDHNKHSDPRQSNNYNQSSNQTPFQPVGNRSLRMPCDDATPPPGGPPQPLLPAPPHPGPRGRHQPPPHPGPPHQPSGSGPFRGAPPPSGPRGPPPSTQYRGPPPPHYRGPPPLSGSRGPPPQHYRGPPPPHFREAPPPSTHFREAPPPSGYRGPPPPTTHYREAPPPSGYRGPPPPTTHYREARPPMAHRQPLSIDPYTNMAYGCSATGYSGGPGPHSYRNPAPVNIPEGRGDKGQGRGRKNNKVDMHYSRERKTMTCIKKDPGEFAVKAAMRQDKLSSNNGRGLWDDGIPENVSQKPRYGNKGHFKKKEVAVPPQPKPPQPNEHVVVSEDDSSESDSGLLDSTIPSVDLNLKTLPAGTQDPPMSLPPNLVPVSQLNTPAPPTTAPLYCFTALDKPDPNSQHPYSTSTPVLVPNDELNKTVTLETSPEYDLMKLSSKLASYNFGSDTDSSNDDA